MRVLLKQKVSEQNGRCAICGKIFQDFVDIVPDHRRPRGMGAGWRDDHPENIAAVHNICNLQKGSRHAPFTLEDPKSDESRRVGHDE